MRKYKKVHPESEIIHITKAVPASYWEIFVYLITGGRAGRLFKAEQQQMKKWTQPINCRCSIEMPRHGRLFDDPKSPN